MAPSKKELIQTIGAFLRGEEGAEEILRKIADEDKSTLPTMDVSTLEIRKVESLLRLKEITTPGCMEIEQIPLRFLPPGMSE